MESRESFRMIVDLELFSDNSTRSYPSDDRLWVGRHACERHCFSSLLRTARAVCFISRIHTGFNSIKSRSCWIFTIERFDSRFRRAFAAATLGDVFNICCIFVILPLELATGWNSTNMLSWDAWSTMDYFRLHWRVQLAHRWSTNRWTRDFLQNPRPVNGSGQSHDTWGSIVFLFGWKRCISRNTRFIAAVIRFFLKTVLQ